MGGGASRLIADSYQLPRLQVAEQQAKVKQVDAEQAELQQQADLVHSPGRLTSQRAIMARLEMRLRAADALGPALKAPPSPRAEP